MILLFQKNLHVFSLYVFRLNQRNHAGLRVRQRGGAVGTRGTQSIHRENDERNPDDMRLFYDAFSRRYFESTIAQVLEAEYHLNRNLSLGGDVCINDFYNFLGIEPIDGGDYLSWFYFYEDGISWIDFNHRKTVLEDGLEVYVVDIVYTPRMDDEPFA